MGCSVHQAFFSAHESMGLHEPSAQCGAAACTLWEWPDCAGGNVPCPLQQAEECGRAVLTLMAGTHSRALGQRPGFVQGRVFTSPA